MLWRPYQAGKKGLAVSGLATLPNRGCFPLPAPDTQT
jgi:hypothetical protein